MNDQYDQEWDAEQEQHWKAEEKHGKTKTQREWCINNKCKLKYTHISGWFPGCIDYMETQREWGTVTEREWDKKWYKRAFFAHDDDFDDEVQAVVEFMHQRDAAIRKECENEYKKEKWSLIPGYEGLYEVSSFGRIKSVSRKAGGGKAARIYPGKILKQKYLADKSGYRRLQIILRKGKKIKSFFIHRLVAKAFIKNPHNKPSVNHIDFDTTNNNVTNLEWCTPKENTAHSYSAGRMYVPNTDNLKYKSNHHLKEQLEGK